MNVAHLILDYVALCEKRRERLDFREFIELWKAADAIAGSVAGFDDTARSDEPAVPDDPNPRRKR